MSGDPIGSARDRVTAYCDAVLRSQHAIGIDTPLPHLTGVIIDFAAPCLRLGDVVCAVIEPDEDSTDRILIYLADRERGDTIDGRYTPALTVDDLIEVVGSAPRP